MLVNKNPWEGVGGGLLIIPVNHIRRMVLVIFITAYSFFSLLVYFTNDGLCIFYTQTYMVWKRLDQLRW